MPGLSGVRGGSLSAAQIINELVETGQAKMYFMNYQFIGPDSTTVGIAGECAYRQDEAAFWEYKTYTYRSQGPESDEWATPQLLADIARENVPALDADELASCLDPDLVRQRSEARVVGLRYGSGCCRGGAAVKFGTNAPGSDRACMKECSYMIGDHV